MLKAEIRKGAYYDSVLLMQLQRSLAALPGVLDAGVMMGTPANKDILQQSGLFAPQVAASNADDLVIVILAESASQADAALQMVDELLTRKRSTDTGFAYRPKSIDSARKMNPQARWVLVSVPGRYATDVVEESLRQGCNVFLYSDNVSLEDEVSLKQKAAAAGLLVMGPDCGTAIVNGTGLGFANRVRSGSIGVIGASGTGLQHVTARIHQLGGGITHAFGTGGRDLSTEVGAITARQSFSLLADDPKTELIVMISKPPNPAVAAKLIRIAGEYAKPVIINFIGYRPDAETLENQDDNLHFTATLDATAKLAVALTQHTPNHHSDAAGKGEGEPFQRTPKTQSQKYLRGLFSGGTLAYEMLLILQEYLPADSANPVYSNIPLDKRFKLDKSTQSQGHTIVDLGEDEFTVGRLHPMMDNDLRIQRLAQEAADPETALILFDVVLGYGAHPDPAGELVPALEAAVSDAKKAGRELDFVAIVVGTDEDPQDMASQIAQLQAAGVRVFLDNEEAARYVGSLFGDRTKALPQSSAVDLTKDVDSPAVSEFAKLDPALLMQPLSAINVGLETFTESLLAQNAEVIQVDWRPPAGGNDRLAALLARMKK